MSDISASAAEARVFLRHTLATLAYRGGKAVRGAPADFGDFRIGAESRTPRQILAHIGDLLDWALWMCRGEHRWNNSEPLPWNEEVARFHGALQELDAILASNVVLGTSIERLFQGPLADALTHVGQLNMLRRLAGSPVRAENYARADIAAGQVGVRQPAPRAEFD